MAAAAPVSGHDSRRAAAMEIVRIHTGLCVAAHFIPAPGLSSVFIAGIHLQMLETLARHYGSPFDRRQASPVLQAFALGATHGLVTKLPDGLQPEGHVENLELYSCIGEIAAQAASLAVVLAVTNAIGPDAHLQWRQNFAGAAGMTAEFVSSRLCARGAGAPSR